MSQKAIHTFTYIKLLIYKLEFCFLMSEKYNNNSWDCLGVYGVC